MTSSAKKEEMPLSLKNSVVYLQHDNMYAEQ